MGESPGRERGNGIKLNRSLSRRINECSALCITACRSQEEPCRQLSLPPSQFFLLVEKQFIDYPNHPSVEVEAMLACR